VGSSVTQRQRLLGLCLESVTACGHDLMVGRKLFLCDMTQKVTTIRNKERKGVSLRVTQKDERRGPDFGVKSGWEGDSVGVGFVVLFQIQ
jgi:hypothetical protein